MLLENTKFSIWNEFVQYFYPLTDSLSHLYRFIFLFYVYIYGITQNCFGYAFNIE